MIKTQILTLAALFSVGAFAKPVTVEMVDLGSNQVVGDVTITQSEYGTVFTPNLKGLELLSNVVYGGSRCSLLMSLHFFHSIDEANIFHNIR